MCIRDRSISFTKLGKFSFIIFSNNFSMSCSSYSPSCTPMIWILERLKLSQRFLSLSSIFFFFEFLFLHSVPVEFNFFLLFQIVDLSPCFLPFNAGPLYIFFVSIGITFTSFFILQPYTVISVSTLIASVLNSASGYILVT